MQWGSHLLILDPKRVLDRAPLDLGRVLGPLTIGLGCVHVLDPAPLDLGRVLGPSNF